MPAVMAARTLPSRPRWALIAALLLAGCAAYDPPITADHTAVRYQSDLRKCRAQAHVLAVQIAGQTPWTEIKSLFASSAPEHADVRKCMTGHGYRLAS